MQGGDVALQALQGHQLNTDLFPIGGNGLEGVLELLVHLVGPRLFGIRAAGFILELGQKLVFFLYAERQRVGQIVPFVLQGSQLGRQGIACRDGTLQLRRQLRQIVAQGGVGLALERQHVRQFGHLPI